MIKIDCFGDICPLPLLKLQQQLEKINSGDTFQLIVDHSCVVESIKDYYSNTAHIFKTEEILNGVWEITITKG